MPGRLDWWWNTPQARERDGLKHATNGTETEIMLNKAWQK